MNEQNQKLIASFYDAFNRKDYKMMQQMYADNASFSDPVFTNLDSKGVRAMWEMLLTASKDLRVVVSDIKATDRSGECKWEAFYTFTATGNKVRNIIFAQLVFDNNGKIVMHTDRFDLYRWSRMAFGITGVLMGWTSFFQNKVRATAMTRLQKFIDKKSGY
jgi:ketosteroid isomerase-like protein